MIKREMYRVPSGMMCSSVNKGEEVISYLLGQFQLGWAEYDHLLGCK